MGDMRNEEERRTDLQDVIAEKSGFVSDIRKAFSLEPQAIQSYSPLTLAYIRITSYNVCYTKLLR